ncbi:hypothetical protein PC118_g11387 [Phytophthora cactorum]|uniref:Uncharacterized protein n=1 Tax=Phytophthora cactorum TaxID=29920 RepID=A0A8T1FQ80_9STRA|nr:hypothetical protein PC111_g10128 [Phytophthora cactorum]KAG2824201.1 hypothetical protein PC112_g10192 [Phytophthora cactorum]KAG2860600.1 hypothetical protein PC113_g7923 [Phytophthora cactorum]KAG2915467.1 hypothetical protein PC114_g7816 [Phytophthora cactorum]KAG2930224.1 hypothetical protein PC115_g6631 [Phytophthora cactorum]
MLLCRLVVSTDKSQSGRDCALLMVVAGYVRIQDATNGAAREESASNMVVASSARTRGCIMQAHRKYTCVKLGDSIYCIGVRE